MRRSAPGGGDDAATVIEEFRANAGHVGGSLAGTSIVLIHHIGAKSGAERVTPLAYIPLQDGCLAIIASHGGAPTHPGWYYNLKANPRITVEVGTRTFTVLAEELDDVARSAVWPKLVAEAPAAGEFQASTARQIPVFVLTPE